MTVESQGEQGIVISKIEDSGPAHKAGLREKDKIVSVDHHPFKRSRQLEAYLSSHGGRPIPVVVMRDDKQQTIMYTPPFRAADSAWLGVLLEEGENDQKGATISQIYPDGPAAQAGLQPGDVISRINDQQIQSASDVIATVAELEPQAQAEFVISRNEKEEKIPVTLGAHHQQAVVQYAPREGEGGQQANGHEVFDAIPPQAMRLEHDRRSAEQHQRIEEEIRALRDEIRQLRDEIKQLKKS
jgi:S1-C subfamily serine protease